MKLKRVTAFLLAAQMLFVTACSEGTVTEDTSAPAGETSASAGETAPAETEEELSDLE